MDTKFCGGTSILPLSLMVLEKMRDSGIAVSMEAFFICSLLSVMTVSLFGGAASGSPLLVLLHATKKVHATKVIGRYLVIIILLVI